MALPVIILVTVFLSIALSKKFTNKMKVIIKREKINGKISSFKKYLYKSLTL